VAADVNGAAGPPGEREDRGGAPEGAGLPEPRGPRAPERPDRPETLPELRAEEVTATLEPYRGAPPPSRYAPRFRALTGALTGLAIGAMIAAAVALFGRGFAPQPDWSAWKPTEGGNAGVTQIARHVGSAYKLPTGDQLVLVTGGPPQVANYSDREVRVKIALASGGGAAAAESDPASISEVRGKTVQFSLRGLGEDGAITQGRPSVERFLLLRREALELALYSFRYLDGVDNVVALLPPAPGEKPQNALFFQRRQLDPALRRPLSATLPAPPPSVTSVEEAPEAPLVKQLTEPSLVRYAFRMQPDYGVFLVLDRQAAAR
jgi:hypothetical protein